MLSLRSDDIRVNGITHRIHEDYCGSKIVYERLYNIAYARDCHKKAVIMSTTYYRMKRAGSDNLKLTKGKRSTYITTTIMPI